MSWTSRSVFAAGAVVLAALFVGCDDDEDGGVAPNPEASVRVAHLSPDAPAVDVWVDGTVVLEDVAFRQFSGYLAVPAGTHRIQVTPANQSSPVVIDESVDLAAGTYTTAAVTGLLASIGVTALADDPATSPMSTNLRFVHASPDAPPVDITLTDGSVVFDDIAFGGSAKVALPAGTATVQVRVAETGRVVLTFADIALAARANVTIYAVGRLANGSLDAIAVPDAPSSGNAVTDLAPAGATLRVAHLSPDAPPVDIYVDGQLVSGLESVPFATVSGYLSVLAATYDLSAFVENTTTSPVIAASVTLLPGTATTVAATGLLSANDLQPLVLTDVRTPNSGGGALVRFVHASPDAPAVDVVAAGGPVLFDGIAFRGATVYGAVAAGTYSLEVRVDAGGALALAVPGVQLQAGQTYTIFAIGRTGDGSLSALPVIDTE